MAAIDDLVERVPDPKLRAALAEQVRRLTSRTEFGLVFQDHLPETLEVPGLPSRRGDRVRLRAATERVDYIVTSRTKTTVEIAVIDSDGNPSDIRSTVDPSEVVVVKDFGEPIYAGLTELGHIYRGGDKPAHVVIEGENYYALEALLYTHEQKIDVIYIDPPYNTGNAAWIYNDRHVDDQDAYRHSKWLAFMQRRLRHAKRLLKPTGVILVAIDDTEHARLKLLLDQVFGEQNFLANIVWAGAGKNDARFTSGGIDYMLAYARDRDGAMASGLRWVETKRGFELAMRLSAEAWEESNHDASSATRLYRAKLRAVREEMDPGVYRYNEIDETGQVFFRADLRKPAPTSRSRYPLLHPLTGQAVPMHPNGWVYSPETMRDKLAEGRILFGPDHTSGAYYKRYLHEVEGQAARPVFDVDRRRASLNLTKVLGSADFPFPKDVDVIARWINIVTGKNQDAVVLDFFAGTGTTAEAVMRLNADDGGRRQAIIVTNNEVGKAVAAKLRKQGHLPGDPEWEAEGVSQKVTRPRMETVTTGRRRDGTRYSDGLDENVAFYRLTYEDPDLIALGRRFSAVAPLLWLHAGGSGSVIDKVAAEGWAMPEGAQYGILFDPAKAEPFVAAVDDAGARVHHAFIVTDSEAVFQAVAAQLPTVPTSMLYSDYLRSFRVNGRD